MLTSIVWQGEKMAAILLPDLHPDILTFSKLNSILRPEAERRSRLSI
jgi:hypothetical protein